MKEPPENIPCSNLTTTTGCFQNNYSLSKMLLPIPVSFSVANWMMSANALNEMFNILPIVIDQTVTVTGNYWATICDTTIATAKWRTVTG